MKLRLGLDLDGERGWHAANRLGDKVVGPAGLLAILETQLGLQRALPSHSERVVQYASASSAATAKSASTTRRSNWMRWAPPKRCWHGATSGTCTDGRAPSLPGQAPG